MSILTELKDDIGTAVTNTKGWIENLEGKMPAIAQAAEKYESSPIIQALETAILPPEIETAIVALIQHFASETPAATASAPATTAVPVTAS